MNIVDNNNSNMTEKLIVSGNTCFYYHLKIIKLIGTD